MSGIVWFSQPYATIEAAQAACNGTGFFQQFGVFETPDGQYVHANLRLRQWNRQEINAIYSNILDLTDNRLVSYTDALFGWTAYRSAGQDEEASEDE